MKVYDICNNAAAGNSCTYNNNKNYTGTGIYDQWVLGRMEVNVSTGRLMHLEMQSQKKNIYISKLNNEKKLSKIAGVTLIEILIGIVISVVMMAAMFTSYNVVNNSYSSN